MSGKYLNLGCGSRIHRDWTNVDFIAAPNVQAHDLRKGIPFPDASFEIVYHSHVLEHFTREGGDAFIRECVRVLKPGGVLRVVVPDLENIARLYLEKLDTAARNPNDAQAAADHEWMILEFYDQTVRTQSGGEMGKYLSQEKIPNEAFVRRRFGAEAAKIIDSARCSPLPLKERAQRAQRGRGEGSRSPRLLKQIRTARFRDSGEIHQWMYDRYSLGQLLQKCGLRDVVQCNATESYVKDWKGFNLDTESDESVYKPDSLFMEGRK